MATMDFSNKEHPKSFNVVHPEQVHHPQIIIIDNPLNNNIPLSYCEMLQKNKLQSNSIAGGKISKSFLKSAALIWILVIVKIDLNRYSLITMLPQCLQEFRLFLDSMKIVQFNVISQ